MKLLGFITSKGNRIFRFYKNIKKIIILVGFTFNTGIQPQFGF
jgi:hypothetical protein